MISSLLLVLHRPLVKGLFIVVLSILWAVYVAPMSQPVLRVLQYGLNIVFYPLVSRAFVDFLYDVTIFFATVKILMWIAAPGVKDELHSESAVDYAKATRGLKVPGVDLPHATGFSSNRIPL